MKLKEKYNLRKALINWIITLLARKKEWLDPQYVKLKLCRIEVNLQEAIWEKTLGVWWNLFTDPEMSTKHGY